MSIETVDDDARWAEIQEMSRRIAYADDPPSPLESALCGAVVRAQDALRRPSQDAYNRLSVLHGDMFTLARSCLAAAWEVLEVARDRLTAEEIEESEFRLKVMDKRVYGPGRQVPPHATGPASYYPPAETQPCFMCMGHGVTVSGHASAPKMKECSHCHGSGLVAKQQSSEGSGQP